MDIEKELHRQRLLIEFIFQVLCSFAEEQGMDLLSRQQLYGPSSERNQKVRMLFDEIRKLG